MTEPSPWWPVGPPTASSLPTPQALPEPHQAARAAALPSAQQNHRALLWLLLAVTLALGWLLAPFFSAILWAAIIALLFAPVQRRLVVAFGQRPSLAALVTLLLVLVIVVLPLALLSTSLANEAAWVYQQVDSGAWNPARWLRGLFDTLPAGVGAVLDRLGLGDFDDLQRRLALALAQASRAIATQAFSMGQGTFHVLASLGITLYLAFFLVRDGQAMARALRAALPLAPVHQRELASKFTTVVRATVKGNLLVAAVQGLLGGLAFWALGVSAALLWAVLMGVLSLLPAVGAALVWGPVALYLFAAGALWQGAALVAWGVLVIGLVDNLLRPLLVGKDTRLPDWLVMVSTLGGLSVFGLNGFVLGPAVAAMFLAVWHIWVSTRGDPV